MALDESKDNDYILKDEESGLIIVADSDLFELTGDINIDWTGMGFNLKTELPIASEDDGCAGCRGGCGEE